MEVSRLDYTNKRFKIIMPIKKAYEGEDGFYYIEYALSTLSKDLEKEQVTENGLKGMVEQAKNINGFEAHEYGLDDVIGPVVDSWIAEDELWVKVRVRPSLKDKIKELIDTGVRLGGSFGGICTKDFMKNGVRMLDEIILLDATLTPLPVNFDTLGSARESSKTCKNNLCGQITKSIRNRYFKKLKEDKNLNSQTIEAKNISLSGERSFEFIRAAVSSQVYSEYDTWDTWAFVLETFPNSETVAVELHSDGGIRLYEIPYTIDDAGDVTLGDPVEVDAQHVKKMMEIFKVKSKFKNPNGGDKMDKKEFTGLLQENNDALAKSIVEALKQDESVSPKKSEPEKVEAKEVDEDKLAEKVTANVLKALGIEIKEEEPEKDAGIIVIDQKALEERDSELIKKALLTIAKQREGQRQSKSVGGGKFEQPQTEVNKTEESEETKTVGGQPVLKTKSITDLAKGVVERSGLIKQS